MTHHLVMYFLKPIEQGLDVKFTGGIHRGCLRVQAADNGKHSIRSRICAANASASPAWERRRSFLRTASLGAHGIDPGKEITWLVFPAGELGLALDKGEVDAVADSEPIGSLLIADGKVKNVADQANDAPYNDEYCCAVLANGKFLAANPKAAAAATRALLKAAKWVEANPAAAARMSVEKKYLASNPELNTVAISHLRYVPSVSGAEAAVKSAAMEMKKAGMLSPTTDVEELAKRAFVHLDGVSDEWLKSLQVEKVAGGQLPPDEDIRLRDRTGAARRPWCGGILLQPGRHQVIVAPPGNEKPAIPAPQPNRCVAVRNDVRSRVILRCRWRVDYAGRSPVCLPNNELPPEARSYTRSFSGVCSCCGRHCRRSSRFFWPRLRRGCGNGSHRCRRRAGSWRSGK